MRKILLFLMGIFFISSVYALGCCFDQSTGTCSPNSDFNSCSGGQFFADPTCNSVSDCDYGCCQIGASSRYVRQASCDTIAKATGMLYTWQPMSLSQCQSVSASQTPGACVTKTKYDTFCSFTIKSSCGGTGNFYQGVLCSDPSLGTNCTKIQNTTCFGEDVYYLDSCGNADVLYSDCDYNQGTICGSYRVGIDSKPSVGNYVCRDLNCAGGKKNGESWCVNLDGSGGVGITPVTSTMTALAIKDLTGNVVKITGNFIPNSFTSSGNLNSGCVNGKTPSGRTCYNDPSGGTITFSGGSSIPVGTRYFRQYCLNGIITTEPCSDFRQESCTESIDSLTNLSSAKCVNNPADDCIMAGNDSSMCDPNYCEMFDLSSADCSQNSYFQGSTRCPSSTYYTTFPDVSETSVIQSKMIDDLKSLVGLPTCIPKISAGQEFYPTKGSSFSTKQASVCDSGDFDTTFTFYKGNYKLDRKADYGEYYYFNVGALQNTQGDWSDADDNDEYLLCGSGNSYCSWAQSKKSQIPISEGFARMLGARCESLGDCEGKANWVNSPGLEATGSNIVADAASGVPIFYIPLSSSTSSTVKYSLHYDCRPYIGPSGTDDCSLCGKDGLPCSEYRCKALGKACDYNDPLGIDNGYCYPSNDLTPPVISCASGGCPTQVHPFSAVTLMINTNEDANCMFDLNMYGKDFASMPYEFGSGYNTSQNITLFVPGQVGFNQSGLDGTALGLITNGGNYSVYVRCQDVAGNWNLAPFLISFSVDPTPDYLPPIISNFMPLSGSAILYNATSKSINFSINEPAECRWSQDDVNYTSMVNDFNCDTTVSTSGVVNGYHCNGILTNVTLNTSQQTRFFINCKDQPWLEGFEDQYYYRNSNPTNTDYILRPSSAFSITDVFPTGSLVSGPALSNFTLSARTSGGAESGRAYCYWKYDFGNISTIFYPFKNTYSSNHDTIIANISEGNYLFQVKCQDAVGNVAYKNSSFSLRIDRSSPIISRVFNDKGNLNLNTDEPAVCKFMFAGNPLSCLFSMSSSNLTSMYGNTNLQHTTPWKKGFTYLIRCADLYGNENSGCGLIAKTY